MLITLLDVLELPWKFRSCQELPQGAMHAHGWPQRLNRYICRSQPQHYYCISADKSCLYSLPNLSQPLPPTLFASAPTLPTPQLPGWAFPHTGAPAGLTESPHPKRIPWSQFPEAAQLLARDPLKFMLLAAPSHGVWLSILQED